MKSIAAMQGELAPMFGALVRERRATPHFRPDPVPSGVIDIALTLAAEAPSGYDAQPWRFLVLRSEARRVALRRAAYDQAKITEAPVVVVAFGLREGWAKPLPEILAERNRRLGLDPALVKKQQDSAHELVAALTPAVWLNRQVMIGFTFLMLAFEAQGWDTAPMEGFDPAAVRKALSLPDEAEIIALLAVGRARDPSTPHPGRMIPAQFAFDEHYGRSWQVQETPAL